MKIQKFKKFILSILFIFLLANVMAFDVPDPFGDYDADGVLNKDDNCYYVYNPFQENIDLDYLGDVCDPSPYGYCGDWICQQNSERIENSENCAHDCEGVPPEAVCGDGVLELGEECDGNLFGDLSCGSFGYSEGSLLCSDVCTINISDCFNIEPECNGAKSHFVQFCDSNWKCSGWGECENNLMTRKCTDANQCELSYNKPTEITNCESLISNVLIEEKTSKFNYPLLAGVLIAVLLIVVLVVLSMGKR